MIRLIACGIFTTLVVGCGQSSYVGQWRAERVPPGMDTVRLDVKTDGTFDGIANADSSNNFAGTWVKGSAGNLVLRLQGRETPGSATLNGQGRLVVDLDEGPPVEFRRMR